MGGHGNSVAGVVVDSGNFPWAEHADRFPMLNEPEPSYHGVVYTEALGPAAYIGRCRTVPLRNTGSAISPLNAFLVLQGIETIHLRMERHCDNAMAVAKYLQGHDKVTWVRYAGLSDSPYYELAKKYRGTAGGGATAELPWAKSYDAGMTEAVKSGKHMLVLFTDGKATAQATEAALAQKELLQHLSKYVLVRQQISRDDAVCKEHRVTTGVQIRVLDPKAPTKPLLRLTGKKTTKSIESSLSRLAKQLDSDREI